MVYFLSGVSQMEYDWAECLRGLLDPCSRERLDTMKHPAARRKFLLGRGLLLYGLRREKGIGCLPPMKITGQGQPVFAEFPLHFSISHSGDAVMAGLHESAIGVDVEFIRPAYDARAALNINKIAWSEEILDAAGIDGDKLPEIMPSTTVIGGVTAEASALTGLKEGTPVVLGGGDGCCANVGASVIEEGQAYCALGSSSWISYTGYKPLFDDDMKIFNWPSLVPGMINPCGTMQAAGVSYSWLKNVICTGEQMQAAAEGKSPYDLMNAQIAESTPGSNGILYLPYLMGERSPRWNPNAKGAFIGLKAEHERKDVLRSVLEGITMNLNVILSIFRKERDFKDLIVIGGGAKGDIWLQILADIFNLDIVKPNYLEEATSMGAAITGGVGVGEFKDFSAIHKFLKPESKVSPIPEHVEEYKKMIPIFDHAYDALVGVFDELSAAF